MHDDLGWPELSDLVRSAGFREFALRCGLGLLVAVAGAALLTGSSVHDLAGLDEALTQVGPLCLPLYAAGWMLPLGTRSQLRWQISAPPRWMDAGNWWAACPWQRERIWSWVLLATAMALGGLAGSLGLLTLLAPVLMLRFSRLWLEIDLMTGQAYHHRTLLGMQWTQAAGDLQLTLGLAADEHGLYAVQPSQRLLLSGPGQDSHSCSELGRRLAAEFHLPFTEHDSRLEDLASKAVCHWPPVQAHHTRTRSPLPPEGEDA